MPNHIHGLIEIDHSFVIDENKSDNKNIDRNCVETTNLGVSDKTNLGVSDKTNLDKQFNVMVVPRIRFGNCPSSID